MPLSRRLELIAALVPEGARVCDVGTDHALLPIYLIKHKKAVHAIAADLRPLPLETAEKNIKKANVSGIETRLCDGLSAVAKNEADTIIAAGMGGEVISGIIDPAEWLRLPPYPLLILQPTTSPEILRRYLYRSGFEINTETAISENNRHYSVMTAIFTGRSIKMPEYFYYTGKTDPGTPDGFLYIEKQYKRLRKRADALKTLPDSDEYAYYSRLSDRLAGILKQAENSDVI